MENKAILKVTSKLGSQRVRLRETAIHGLLDRASTIMQRNGAVLEFLRVENAVLAGLPDSFMVTNGCISGMEAKLQKGLTIVVRNYQYRMAHDFVKWGIPYFYAVLPVQEGVLKIYKASDLLEFDTMAKATDAVIYMTGEPIITASLDDAKALG